MGFYEHYKIKLNGEIKSELSNYSLDDLYYLSLVSLYYAESTWTDRCFHELITNFFPWVRLGAYDNKELFSFGCQFQPQTIRSVDIVTNALLQEFAKKTLLEKKSFGTVQTTKGKYHEKDVLERIADPSFNYKEYDKMRTMTLYFFGTEYSYKVSEELYNIIAEVAKESPDKIEQAFDIVLSLIKYCFKPLSNGKVPPFK